MALGRAIRPAYEGIETVCLCASSRLFASVARSAPLMRGLKPSVCVPAAGCLPASRDPPRL